MINRFTKTEIDVLVDALQLPDQIVASNIILKDSQNRTLCNGDTLQEDES